MKDRRHARVRECWITLNNLNIATLGAEAVMSAVQFQHEVLQASWHALAKAENWDACVDIAAALTELRPDLSFGWIQLAVALRHLGRFEKALRVLGRAIRACGDTPTFAFYRASCHAKIGNSVKARMHLRRAFQLAKGSLAMRRPPDRSANGAATQPFWEGKTRR